jgi:tRNA pseudouridine38-40 synthase
VPDDFHASRSAVGKTYRYRIYISPQRPVARAWQVYHFWRPLAVEPMREAARRILGTHDFRGLATSAEKRENTVRTIFRCEVSRQEDEIHVAVQGDGFLYNMVRNLVGTLIEVGREHWGPECVDKLLASRERKDCGPTSPPDGLTLMCVHYDPADLRVI